LNRCEVFYISIKGFAGFIQKAQEQEEVE